MKKNNTPVSFMLTNIKTLEFACFEDLVPKEDRFVKVNLNVGFLVQSWDNAKLACVPEVTLFNKKTPFVKIKVACEFAIKPDDWGKLQNKKNHSIILPKGFADHLLVLSVGTLRGVLHAKTEGTACGKYPLPTMDVSKIIEEDPEIMAKK